jgi:hypothetical protein
MRHSIENQRRYRKNNPEKLAKRQRVYRKTHKKNKDSIRASSFRHKLKTLGITAVDYDKMYNEQNGRCAICGKHQLELNKSLHLDHCHLTGIVRGILCSNCNTGLGLFKDDIKILRCAISYLDKYK